MQWYNGNTIVDEVWSETTKDGVTMSVFRPVDPAEEEDEFILYLQEGESPFSYGWEPVAESEVELHHLFNQFRDIFGGEK